ncbi:MAG: DUF3515 family protein [Dermatophilaceae bacterium]
MWPTSVADRSRRATSPLDPSTAAWGDPAIIARCGYAALAPTTADCLSVDGIDWIIRELTDGTAFTTYGTDPAVEVLVPESYAPETMVLPDFDDAARTLPQTGHHCT